jgi:hypothetical protein
LLLDIRIPHATGIDIAEFLMVQHLTPPMMVAHTSYVSAKHRKGDR